MARRTNRKRRTNRRQRSPISPNLTGNYIENMAPPRNPIPGYNGPGLLGLPADYQAGDIVQLAEQGGLDAVLERQVENFNKIEGQYPDAPPMGLLAGPNTPLEVIRAYAEYNIPIPDEYALPDTTPPAYNDGTGAAGSAATASNPRHDIANADMGEGQYETSTDPVEWRNQYWANEPDDLIAGGSGRDTLGGAQAQDSLADVPTPSFRPDPANISAINNQMAYQEAAYAQPVSPVDQPGSAPIQAAPGVTAGTAADMKAINNFAREWGVNNTALAGALNIESGLNPAATNGKYHGVFALSSSQVPSLTEAAGLGRLTPEQYRGKSVSDQMKVMDAYYRSYGLKPSENYFTGDAKKDTARLWGMQLAPSKAAAGKIDFNDPNAVISPTNQADRIEAKQGLVTVGSVISATVNEGLAVVQNAGRAAVSQPAQVAQDQELDQYGLLGPREAVSVNRSMSPMLSTTRGGQSYMTKADASNRMAATLANPFDAMRENYEMMTGQEFPPINDAIAKAGTTRENKTPGSQHFRGQALDISTAGLTNTQKQALAQSAQIAGFKGLGFGRNIMHVDTGNRRGWSYGNKSFGGRSVADMIDQISNNRSFVPAGTANTFTPSFRPDPSQPQQAPSRAAGFAGDMAPVGQSAFQGRTADQLPSAQQSYFSDMSAANPGNSWDDLADNSQVPDNVGAATQTSGRGGGYDFSSPVSNYAPADPVSLNAMEQMGVFGAAAQPQFETITTYETKSVPNPAYNAGKGGTYGYDDEDWWDDDLMADYLPGDKKATPTTPDVPKTIQVRTPVTRQVQVAPGKKVSPFDRLTTRGRAVKSKTGTRVGGLLGSLFGPLGGLAGRAAGNQIGAAIANNYGGQFTGNATPNLANSRNVGTAKAVYSAPKSAGPVHGYASSGALISRDPETGWIGRTSNVNGNGPVTTVTTHNGMTATSGGLFGGDGGGGGGK